MGQINPNAMGNIHPHISVRQAEILCTVGEDGVRFLGSHALPEEVGMTDEVRAEILEGELKGVVTAEGIDVSEEAELFGLHYEDTGELLTPGPDARADYTGGVYL
jgi:hypothetical protein